MSTVYVRLPTPVPGTLLRAPLLERVLAHAAASAASIVADWRSEAFGVIAGEGVTVPPIAAAALYGARGAVAGEWACVASPVHLVAGMSHVSLPPDGILALQAREAAPLAQDFNRVFGDSGVRLEVGRGSLLLGVFDRRLEVTTRDPEDVVGGDVYGAQPAGRDAPCLRRLMSEMEMWLFDHEVNRGRAATSQSPITGLWLWGGGPLLPSLPPVQGWTAGRDPLFAAFGDAAAPAGETAAGVWVCAEPPGSARWPELEARWLAPLWAGLRSGRIERLEFAAADRRVSVRGGRSWRSWRSSRLWRRWRQPPPWWESFGKDSEWQ